MTINAAKFVFENAWRRINSISFYNNKKKKKKQICIMAEIWKLNVTVFI